MTGSSLFTRCLMAAAAVAGTGSLVMFLALPLGSLTILDPGWPEPSMLGWDAGLSLLFFLQHSGMIRARFRARMALVLPERFHGVVYALASGIVLTLVILLWQTSPTSWFVIRGPALWVVRTCALLAVLVFLWSMWALRTFDPLGFGPLRAHLRRLPYRPPPFVLRGPYRWVRHPLYVCLLVLIWTGRDFTSDRLLFDLMWTAWIVMAARPEERDLLARFGETYRDYQRRVPMFVPWRRPVAQG